MKWFLLRKPGMPLENSDCHAESTLVTWEWTFLVISSCCCETRHSYGCRNVTGRGLKGIHGPIFTCLVGLRSNLNVFKLSLL